MAFGNVGLKVQGFADFGLGSHGSDGEINANKSSDRLHPVLLATARHRSSAALNSVRSAGDDRCDEDWDGHANDKAGGDLTL